MANPPIVIGPFDNVPAPGSPIRSNWSQEISQYVTDHIAALYARLNNAMIRSGGATVTSDGSGFVIVAYGGPAYPQAPIVVFSIVDATGGQDAFATIYDRQPTYFVLRVRNAAGTPVGNTSFTIHWHAMLAQSL